MELELDLGWFNMGDLYKYGWLAMASKEKHRPNIIDGHEIVIPAGSPPVVIVIGFEQKRSAVLQAPSVASGWRTHELADAIVQHYVDVAVAEQEPDDDMFCTANGRLEDALIRFNTNPIEVYPNLDY